MLADLAPCLPDLRRGVATTALALAAAWLAAWAVTWPPATPAAHPAARPQALAALPAGQDAYPLYRKVVDALDTTAIYQANKAFEAFKRAPAAGFPGECANQAAANRLRLLALAQGRGRAAVQLPLEPGAPLPAYLYTSLGQVAGMACAHDLAAGHPEKAARTVAALADMCVKFARARGAGGKVYATFAGCGLAVLDGLAPYKAQLLAAPHPVKAQLAGELDRFARLAPPLDAIPRGELTQLAATWQDGPYLTTPLYHFRERYGQVPATHAWRYPETGGIGAVAPVAAAVPLMEAALRAGDFQKLRHLADPPGGDEFLRGTTPTAVLHPNGYARWLVLQQAVEEVGRGAQAWQAFTRAAGSLRQELVRG